MNICIIYVKLFSYAKNVTNSRHSLYPCLTEKRQKNMAIVEKTAKKSYGDTFCHTLYL